MLDVPATPTVNLHFVWIGRRFPYHCRLAVESAVVAMPTARVHVHLLDGASDAEHLVRVEALPHVELHTDGLGETLAVCPGGAEPYLRLIERIPGRSPAAVSNLARLAVLYRWGGVYLDTDVLVLRGLHDPDRHGAYIGVERVWADNRRRLTHGVSPAMVARAVPWAARWAVCRLDSKLTHGRMHAVDRWGVDRGSMRLQANNAVIGAPSRAPFLAAALRGALDVDPTKRFALGPNLVDDVAREWPPTVHVVPQSRFYAVPPGQSYRFFEDRHLRLPPDAQVIHYVNSNHRDLLRRLEPDDRRFERDPAVFWDVARRVRRSLPDVVSSSGRSPLQVPG